MRRSGGDDARVVEFNGDPSAMAGAGRRAGPRPSRCPVGKRPAGSRGDTTLLAAVYAGASTGPQASDAVHAIRNLPAPAGVTMLVGGRTAQDMDRIHSLAVYLPWMAAIMATVTLVLLFLAFGSVLLPVKAVVMNLVSIGASFGVVIWIFQDGHLSHLLGFTATGPWNPPRRSSCWPRSSAWPPTTRCSCWPGYARNTTLPATTPPRSPPGCNAPARSSPPPRCCSSWSWLAWPPARSSSPRSSGLARSPPSRWTRPSCRHSSFPRPCDCSPVELVGPWLPRHPLPPIRHQRSHQRLPRGAPADHARTHGITPPPRGRPHHWVGREHAGALTPRPRGPKPRADRRRAAASHRSRPRRPRPLAYPCDEIRACQSHSLPRWSPERSADEAPAALLLRSASPPCLIFYTGRFGNALPSTATFDKYLRCCRRPSTPSALHAAVNVLAPWRRACRTGQYAHARGSHSSADPARRIGDMRVANL